MAILQLLRWGLAWSALIFYGKQSSHFRMWKPLPCLRSVVNFTNILQAAFLWLHICFKETRLVWPSTLLESWSLLESDVTCSQFHQHITSSFFTNFFSPKKLQTQTVSAENLRKTLSYQKFARNMLVKLTSDNLFHRCDDSDWCLSEDLLLID